ncbi:MAG: hypothetical protein P3A28_06830 [Gemmatimonadota bacterium]|nr:hypothetical protein [Gemmatimonadota bacterium]
MHVNRSGATSLAELCIALVLGSVAAAVGLGVLVTAERHARRDRDSGRESQAVRDVSHVLVTEVASARAGSIVARGDTAIDIASHVGVSVACRVGADELVLPPAQTSLAAPYTHWRHVAEAGDQLSVWDTTAGGRWVSARVDSVAAKPDGAGCPADGAFRSVADSVVRRPVTWLRVSPPPPPGVVRGAPVRVYRELRWMLYRSSGKAWWLGTRRCSAGCAAAQPVAGPLAAPGDSGLVFEPMPDGGLTITLRAEPPVRGGGSPAARIVVAPHGGARDRE